MDSTRGGRPRKVDPDDFPQDAPGERRVAAALSTLIATAGSAQRVIDAAPSLMKSSGLGSSRRVTEALRKNPVQDHVLAAVVTGCANILGRDASELQAEVQALRNSPHHTPPPQRPAWEYARQAQVLLEEGLLEAAAIVVWRYRRPVEVVRLLVDRAPELSCSSRSAGM